jgi:hypothetical protein
MPSLRLTIESVLAQLALRVDATSVQLHKDLKAALDATMPAPLKDIPYVLPAPYQKAAWKIESVNSPDLYSAEQLTADVARADRLGCQRGLEAAKTACQHLSGTQWASLEAANECADAISNLQQA